MIAAPYIQSISEGLPFIYFLNKWIHLGMAFFPINPVSSPYHKRVFSLTKHLLFSVFLDVALDKYILKT